MGLEAGEPFGELGWDASEVWNSAASAEKADSTGTSLTVRAGRTACSILRRAQKGLLASRACKIRPVKQSRSRKQIFLAKRMPEEARIRKLAIGLCKAFWMAENNACRATLRGDRLLKAQT